MARRRYGSRGNEGQQSREKKIIRRIFEMNIQQGYSPSRIAAALNEEKVLALTEGISWSEQQVTRILDQHPKLLKTVTGEHEKQADPRRLMYLSLESDGPQWNEDTGRYEEGEAVYVTYEEHQREMREAEQAAREAAEATRLEYVAKPIVFVDPASIPMQNWNPDDVEASADIGRLGLAGHDTWDRGLICELVREQTQRTGKDVHELLSRIEGNPSVKGPLRRAVWGLLREIALQRQANLSLRQRLRPAPAAPVEPKEPLPWPLWEEMMKDEAGLVTEAMIDEAREEERLRSDARTTPPIDSDSPQHSP